MVPPGGPRGLDRHDRILQDRPVLLLEDVVDGRAVEGERDLAGEERLVVAEACPGHRVGRHRFVRQVDLARPADDRPPRVVHDRLVVPLLVGPAPAVRVEERLEHTVAVGAAVPALAERVLHHALGLDDPVGFADLLPSGGNLHPRLPEDVRSDELHVRDVVERDRVIAAVGRAHDRQRRLEHRAVRPHQLVRQVREVRELAHAAVARRADRLELADVGQGVRLDRGDVLCLDVVEREVLDHGVDALRRGPALDRVLERAVGVRDVGAQEPHADLRLLGARGGGDAGQEEQGREDDRQAADERGHGSASLGHGVPRVGAGLQAMVRGRPHRGQAAPRPLDSDRRAVV